MLVINSPCFCLSKNSLILQLFLKSISSEYRLVGKQVVVSVLTVWHVISLLFFIHCFCEKSGISLIVAHSRHTFSDALKIFLISLVFSNLAVKCLSLVFFILSGLSFIVHLESVAWNLLSVWKNHSYFLFTYFSDSIFFPLLLLKLQLHVHRCFHSCVFVQSFYLSLLHSMYFHLSHLLFPYFFFLSYI